MQRCSDQQLQTQEVLVPRWLAIGSVVSLRRPTKLFQDAVAGGGEGLRVLRLTGVTPIEGGVPIIVDGKVVGAIGVSGGSSDQDGQVARTGAGAAK